MNEIMQEYNISIDFANKIVNRDKMIIVQDDNISTRLNISVLDEIEDDQNLTLIFEKPDGTSKSYSLILTEKKSTFDVPNDVLNLSGYAKISFVYIYGEKKLTNYDFIVDIKIEAKIGQLEDLNEEELSSFESVIGQLNEKLVEVNELESTVEVAESSRIESENNRIIAENDRVNAQVTRNTSEIERLQNESNRVISENDRVQNELTRIEFENNRVIVENDRVQNELNRQTAESSRIVAESDRNQKELERESAETSRESQEQERETNSANTINSCNTATNNANSAANSANTAATNAQDVANEVTSKLNNGDFNIPVIQITEEEYDALSDEEIDDNAFYIDSLSW